MSKLLAIMLVLGISSGCQKEFTEPQNTEDYGEMILKSAKATNLLVITKSETLPADFEEKLSVYGEVVRSLPEIGEIVIKPTVKNAEKEISKLGEVLAVVPDMEIKWIKPVESMNNATPEGVAGVEPYSWYQWGMDAIHAPEAWSVGQTGKDAKVFILDTGIDSDHPDLAPNLNTDLCISLIEGEEYDVDYDGNSWHGTHVAGIIAAAFNNFGVIGVAPEAEIIAVKVLAGNKGSGPFSVINQGILYAADNGADVINMSLGAMFNRNGFIVQDGVLYKIPAIVIQNIILAQQRAVNYAFRKGAVIITSAGNNGTNFDGNAYITSIPAELQNVIAVSATAPYNWYNDLLNGIIPNLDIPASYTDYGKSLVDLAAPGGDFDSFNLTNWYLDMVLSTDFDGLAWTAGTSMASPHVAGVAALIIGKNGGQMDPSVVRKQLLKTADKIDGMGVSPWFGYGRVNAYRAVTE